jgi:hypothetical protein
VSLVRGSYSLSAATVVIEDPTHLRAEFDLPVVAAGPHDILITRPANDTTFADTLRGEVRVSAFSSLSYDSASSGAAPDTGNVLAGANCPQRNIYFDIPTGTLGATGFPCRPEDPTTSDGCYSAYPSLPNEPNIRRETFAIARCDGFYETHTPVVVEFHPKAFSAEHCHHGGTKTVGTVAYGGSECEELPDGGRRCIGSTGFDGLRFEITHTWPEVAGPMSVVFYSTDPSREFYLATDTVFTLCASARSSILPWTAGIPDTLEFVGMNATHPQNHGMRESTSKAIREAARKWRAMSSKLLQLNDASLNWGGLFDICAEPGVCASGVREWTRPHSEHRLGNNIDLRTILFGAPIYKRRELDALQAILEDHFSILKHPSGPNDPSAPHWHLRIREDTMDWIE